MPCRVGITTDPKRRRTEWECKVYGLTNFRVIKKFRSKQKAQEYENWYADRYSCQAGAGGPEASGMWYVYRFNYTRKR